jgi:hypothetical protein
MESSSPPAETSWFKRLRSGERADITAEAAHPETSAKNMKAADRVISRSSVMTPAP